MALENNSFAHNRNALRSTSELFNIKYEIYFWEEFVEKFQQCKRAFESYIKRPEEDLLRPHTLYEELILYITGELPFLSEELVKFHALKNVPTSDVMKYIEQIKTNRELTANKIKLLQGVLEEEERHQKERQSYSERAYKDTIVDISDHLAKKITTTTSPVQGQNTLVDLHKAQEIMYQHELSKWKALHEGALLQGNRYTVTIAERCIGELREELGNAQSTFPYDTLRRIKTIREGLIQTQFSKSQVVQISTAEGKVQKKKDTLVSTSQKSSPVLFRKNSSKSVAKDRLKLVLVEDRLATREVDDFAPLRQEEGQAFSFLRSTKAKILGVLAMAGISASVAQLGGKIEKDSLDHKVNTRHTSPIVPVQQNVEKAKSLVRTQHTVRQKQEDGQHISRILHKVQNIHPLKGVHIGSYAKDGKCYVPFTLDEMAAKNPELSNAMDTAFKVSVKAVIEDPKGAYLVEGEKYRNNHWSVHPASPQPLTVYVEVIGHDGKVTQFGVGTMFTPVFQKQQPGAEISTHKQTFTPPEIVKKEVAPTIHHTLAKQHKETHTAQPSSSFWSRTKNLLSSVGKQVKNFF